MSVLVSYPSGIQFPSDKRVRRKFLVIKNRIGVREGFRRCIKCGEAKPADLVHFGRKSGKYLSSWCRSCAAEHAKAKMRARRADPVEREKVIEARNRHAKSEQGRAWKRRASVRDNHIRRQRTTQRLFDWDADRWEICKREWNWTCAYCGKSSVLSQDHFIPLSDPDCPGTFAGNIVPACASCNSRKNDRSPFVWASVASLQRILPYLRQRGL